MPPGTNHRLDLFRIQALDSDREFLQVKNLKTGIVTDLEVSGLFFAIGHEPASKFLGGQLDTDSDGYVLTKPGTTQTNVPGVFAAGDVQDKKYRQAITAAGSGCMAALEAEHFLQEHNIQEGKSEPQQLEMVSSI
jgi:thioredoxin reductase (NADPH)